MKHILSSIFVLSIIGLPVLSWGDGILRIGVMLCLTGDCAEWGSNGVKGAQVAAEELNRRGGVLGKTIELVIENSQDTVPRDTVSIFQKLTQDRSIHFIVGPTWTVGAMPIAPLIAQRKDLVVISPSVGLKEFNESASNIFNTWPHDEIGTRALAKYARSKGWLNGAIFGSQNPYCLSQSKIFREEFEALGGKITVLEEPLPDSRELKVEALRIKAASPDFVMLTHYQYDVIAKNFRDLHFKAPLLALLMEKDRVKSAEGALEGTTFALYDKPRESFSENFRRKFGSEPGITADTAYDAVMLFAHVITTSEKTDAESIQNELFKTKNFQGASGTFSFDEKGAVNKKPVLWRVKGSEYELAQ